LKIVVQLSPIIIKCAVDLEDAYVLGLTWLEGVIELIELRKTVGHLAVLELDTLKPPNWHLNDHHRQHLHPVPRLHLLGQHRRGVHRHRYSVIPIRTPGISQRECHLMHAAVSEAARGQAQGGGGGQGDKGGDGRCEGEGEGVALEVLDGGQGDRAGRLIYSHGDI
jgi:hypothetical protein